MGVVMLTVIIQNVIMLNVIMLNVIMLNVNMLNVNMLSVIMLNVIMPSVILLNVIMLNVAAPFFSFLSLWQQKKLSRLNQFELRDRCFYWGNDIQMNDTEKNNTKEYGPQHNSTPE
jgi:hypothetical protein